MALPTYDPGGTQRTQAQQANNASPDAFGAGVGRALEQGGQQIGQLGSTMMALEKKQRDMDDTTAVTDAYTDGTSRMRQALYGEGGLYSRTGTNAEGLTEATRQTADTIRADVEKRLTTPEQKAAFSQMWGRHSEGIENQAAGQEFKQRTEVRTATKTAALSNLTDEVIANYNDEEMLATNFDAARAIIRANPDGLPENLVAQMERESLSAMNVAVINRMAQDDPGRAMDYYTRHKGQVSGTDHAKVDAMISGVSQARNASAAVTEIAGGGAAGRIVRSVIFGESSGNVNTADSPAGAAGLMQVMPETAREVAATLPGMSNIAGMTDDELSTYWRTPAGQRANVRIGTTYLNKQITRFGGDLEAALIAYNAGPGNAVKFLNSGRDYNSLPKPEETLPYVKKVLGHERGVEIMGNTSADIQRTLKGGAAEFFKGDPTSFLLGKLQAGHPQTYITEMVPELQQRLAGMMNDAPDFVKAGLQVLSGTRSIPKQTQLWEAELKKQGGNVAAARKNVAPPPGVHGSKGSEHNFGKAADLGWNGARLSSAPREVVQWIHDNAGRYNLKFPLGNEDWHVEIAETRGGKGGKQGRVNAGDVADARVRRAFVDDQPAGPSTVELVDDTGNPADIYTKLASPFTVQPDATNLTDWLQQARDTYADNPPLLAEVERQLTDQAQMKQTAQKADQEQIKTDIFRSIVEGGTVKDFDPLKREQLGPDGVKSMLDFESSWNRESNESDPSTYYKLSQMTGKQLHELGPNIVDFASQLSKADLKSFIDKAGTFAKGGAAARSTDQTRTQIITSAQSILGLDPNKTPADAVTMAALNRALNTQIEAHVETSGNEPTGPEMQKMVDDLIVQGKVKGSGWLSDDTKAAFELTPDEKVRFTPADALDDIPQEALPTVAQGFNKIWNVNPDETAAIDFYNDLARVKLGAAPPPPAQLEPRIRQGLAQHLGRMPTSEEVAAFYREWIIKATAAQ